MNIKAMQKRLRDFAAAREWQSFHSPKNLAMALMVESAELLELFQWLTTEQSHTLTQEPADREKVSDEIADVFLYLLQIADRTGIDLEEAVEKKLIKNALKHPAKLPEVLPSGPKVHLLVDCENVNPDAEALRQLVPDGTDVWLFHAPAQRVDAEKHKRAYGANSVTLVERTGAGKNALDFQLSYYAGYLMARQPDARFVVVSNDKGYEPMLEHARKLEFQATRSEYRKPPTLAAPAAPAVQVVKPASAQKKPAPVDKKLLPTLSRPKLVPLAKPLVAEPTSARIAFRAKDALSLLVANQRPASREALLTLTEGLITEPVADRQDLARKACRVLQLYGTVMLDVDGGNLRYRCPDPVQRAASAELVVNAVQAPVLPVVAVEKAAIQPKAVTKPKVVKPLAAKPKQGVSHVAKRVELSLKKMTSNRPVRRDGLMKVIATHIGTVLSPVMTPEQVCIVLQSRQVVRISPKGEVAYFSKAKTVKPPETKVQQQTSG
ncbi:MAG: nucleotide pyrophosphohydrolase [Comamonas sp.]|uniref:nucleotide pyrophosphohydrolase n=1 Tax=Comamonas sp. TaxID=34028 RepID=UPI002FCC5B5C